MCILHSLGAQQAGILPLVQLTARGSSLIEQAYYSVGVAGRRSAGGEGVSCM